MKRTRAALESEEEEEVVPRRSSQKQKKTTRSRRGVEDSDDDVIGSQQLSDDPDEFDGTLDFTQPDYAMTQPVASQTPVEGETTKKPPSIPSRVGQLSAKAIDDLTAQLVRYMLYKAGLKLPIKFADISKEVYPKYKNVSRYFFQKAKQQLETVFGYEVVAVDDNSSKELYLVLNACKSQEHLLLVNKNDRSATRGFLMMVLGLLWCASGRQLSEEDLWKQLELLDSSISPNRDHRQLGDVAQLLKTFENQLYLNSSSELDGDLKKVRFYSYGARTHLEVGKLQILNFVCKLITGRPPTEHQISELNLENN
ncbi:hypothetical protein Poli38472_006268 [Pythium oligandrum]|uniref:MAGE domain-containing protein n=1 Tax=Pythium oligandrum TaxID=41045 RepID=A0A8K1CSK7_PYTOL|nr:hypothetical protein Poli38472_006268 [Pythium oligandrum]|eukprot:TMW68800.1 hypothetical protein Poli38472_006268 [Pythium oligandrum]